LVLGPVVIQPERSASTTSPISSSPIKGGAKGRNSLRRETVGPVGTNGKVIVTLRLSGFAGGVSQGACG